MQRINEATARRMCVLRHMKMGSDQGAKSRFAVWLGIETKRWNNFEHGWSVPRLVGHRLCERIPGLTLDWLFLGHEQTLSQRLLEELRRAEEEWSKTAGGQPKSPSRSGTNSRSTKSRA